jgi:hypothetical protein
MLGGFGSLVLSVLLLVALFSSPAHAGFLGNTVAADYHWPNLRTVLYPSGNAVVGAGIEFPNVGGFGVGISPSVDISDTNILITYPVGFSFAPPPKTFDGWVISDILGAIPNIIGVSLRGTNIPGYDASQLSFDSDHVFINQLNFASFAANAFISVDVQFESVGPGPAILISPSGSITDNTPTYTWNAVSTATWYLLWVNDSTGNKIQQWYTASAVGCASGAGTCTVRPSTMLASGSGTWWVLAWNTAGYGPWSRGMSFTVHANSRDVQLVPSGDFKVLIFQKLQTISSNASQIVEELAIENITGAWYVVRPRIVGGITGPDLPTEDIMIGPRQVMSLGRVTFPKRSQLLFLADNSIDVGSCTPICDLQTRRILGALALELLWRVATGGAYPTDEWEQILALTALEVQSPVVDLGIDIYQGDILAIVGDLPPVLEDPIVTALLAKYGASATLPSWLTVYARAAQVARLLIETLIYSHSGKLVFDAR